MVRLGIIVSEMHWDITGSMFEVAKRHAEFLGAEIVVEILVPGAYEIPLAAKKLVERKDIDAVVTLGTVIEGETEHDEVIMKDISRMLMNLSIEYGKPIALGISGPGISRLQALERVDEYTKRAVEAAVKTVKRLEKVKA